MKSILFVSAALMLGASIYGFVDYKKANSGKEFKNMYDEKEVVQPPMIEEKKLEAAQIDPAIETKKNVAPPNDEKKKDAKKGTTVKKAMTPKKKNELNSKLFSRAALREVPERTPEKLKKENLKEEKPAQ